MLLRIGVVPSRSWFLLGSATAAASLLFLILVFNQNDAFHGRFSGGSKAWGTGARPTQTSPPELAIATFLTGQAKDDTYYNATKLLAYQFLHDKPTRLTNPNITFVVLCGQKLPEEKREVLRSFGATIIPLDDVELPEWIHIGEPRWSEQFTKLRVFERTEFKRILYMDADHLVMHPMDDIFEDPIIQNMPSPLNREAEIKADEGPLPKKWLFAARSEHGMLNGHNHDVPPLQCTYANGGFWITAPDKDMFEHLMTVMRCKDRFRTAFMEQDMLNYVFRRDGPMPWRELHWKWNSNFVNQKDVEFGVHSLHGHFWQEGPDSVHHMLGNLTEKMYQFEKTL